MDDETDAPDLPAFYWEIGDSPCHVTSLEALRSILVDGKIHPNRCGHYPVTFPQSNVSVGRKLGAVCLFDFASADELAARRYRQWVSFFYKHRPVTVVLCLDRAHLPQLLTQTTAKDVLDEPVADLGVCFPRVEAWHLGEIPVSAIARCLVYCTVATDLPFAEIPPGAAMYRDAAAAASRFEREYAEEYRRSRMSWMESLAEMIRDDPDGALAAELQRLSHLDRDQPETLESDDE